MNLQDIAKKEAERYLIDNSAMLHSKLLTSPATVITETLLHGANFCLNTLAGSEGDIDKELYHLCSDWVNDLANYGRNDNSVIDLNDEIKQLVQEHTASAVAKAMGENEKVKGLLLKFNDVIDAYWNNTNRHNDLEIHSQHIIAVQQEIKQILLPTPPSK